MSWVVIDKETGKAVCELYSSKLVAKLRDKYEAVEAGTYLERLNRRLNDGRTYADKVKLEG